MRRLRRQRDVVAVGRRHALLAPVFVLLAAVVLSACRNAVAPEPSPDEQVELALRRGQLQEAETIVAAQLTASHPEASEQSWRYQLLHAEILLARVELPRALPILTAALPSGGAFDSLRARQQYLLAKAQVIQGALDAASQTARAALDSGQLTRELEWEAKVLDGQIKLRRGMFTEAETTLNEVAAAAAAAGDPYRQALALNNLGMGRLVRRRFDEALVWFERVLDLNPIDDTTVYGAALNNAGICYARLGLLERAVATQRRAVEFHERGSRVAFEQAVGELGTTYLLGEDYTNGLDHLRRALAIAAEANLAADASLWAKNLAAGYHLTGQLDEAEHFNREARRLNPKATPASLAWNTVYDGHIAAKRGRHDEAVRFYNEAMAAARDVPAVQWAALGGLGDVAAATGRDDEAERHFAAALAIVENTRSDLLKADYRISFLTTLIDFYRRYVTLLVQRGKHERALEVVESSRARVLAERHGITAAARPAAAAMRRIAADSRTVLLSYWLAPQQSYVWAISRSGIKVFQMPGAAEIAPLVKAHRAVIDNALADPLAGPDTPGHRLYTMLIAPVETSIPEGSSLVIAPDGALHQLNFETLPTGDRYLIERVKVQVAPSLALLRADRHKPAANRSLLLIGDAQARQPEFPALQYASAEMAGVAAHFAGNTVTTIKGERAVPHAYRQAKPGEFGIIHFTAHATANPESPLDSAVILSGPEDAHKLYARDVAEQPLQADLVTVSACRSAGERAYSGEGLVGFAWAFLRAGANRVIAGLWDVDDRSTAQLMERVYAGIAAGAAPGDALRDAKLAFLRGAGVYAKPYYWAPFQLFTVSP